MATVWDTATLEIIKPSPFITSNSLFQHVSMLSVEDYKAIIKVNKHF